MILGYSEILWRLKFGMIFRGGTWSKSCIKEASYALRVAHNGWMIDGELCAPEMESPKSSLAIKPLVIKPGAIAILSTVEILNMPNNIVGHLGIRYDFANKGLTRLMGIQIDPGYGQEYQDERLYLRVANLGNHPIPIHPMDLVFNVEFREMKGRIDDESLMHKKPTWDRLVRSLGNQPDPSWSYLTQVKYNLEQEMEGVRRGLQPVVLFGVFLVAATLLSVAISVILTLDDVPPVKTPPWVTNWGWIILMVSLSISALAVAAIGGATAWHFLKGNGITRS